MISGLKLLTISSILTYPHTHHYSIEFETALLGVILETYQTLGMAHQIPACQIMQLCIQMTSTPWPRATATGYAIRKHKNREVSRPPSLDSLSILI